MAYSIKVINSGITGSTSTWHATTWHSSWHTTWHPPWHSSSSWSASGCLVNSHHYWVELSFKFFLFSFNYFSVGILVTFKPLKTFSRSFLNQFLIIICEMSLKLFIIKSVLHLEAVVLETVFGLNFLSDSLILSLEFLSIVHHLFNFFFGKSSFIIGNGNFVLFSSSLVNSRHVK